MFDLRWFESKAGLARVAQLELREVHGARSRGGEIRAAQDVDGGDLLPADKIGDTVFVTGIFEFESMSGTPSANMLHLFSDFEKLQPRKLQR